jgi:hypothetical protein
MLRRNRRSAISRPHAHPACNPLAPVERLEPRRVLDADPLPVAMWIERDNGDDAYYASIESYATSSQTLAADKLLLRLADPASPDASIKSNFQLDLQANLLKTIHSLGAKGYAGTIALIPDFTGGQDWNWNPATSPAITAKWQKAFYWAAEANTLLADAGSSLLIGEVTIEVEASGIPATSQTLSDIRDYQRQLWPEMQANPKFVGTGMAHGFTTLVQMAQWTSGDADTRLLDAAYCELYNMYKSSGDTTYVDAYEQGTTINPPPAPQWPDTIYSLARNEADPVAAVLGTPGVAPAESTFGYLVGSHTSAGMPADLSRVYLIYSAEKTGVGGSLIDAFGTWDAPPAGPGAGVDDFAEFCRDMNTAFMPFWNATTPPNVCVFQFELLPETWIAPTIPAVAAPQSFDDWRFVMWDYRECGTDLDSLVAYHQWLLGYLADHPPSRLILYVTDPSVAGNAFYDPLATPAANAGNFAGFLEGVAHLSTPVSIEILFDRASFPASASGGEPAGWEPMPTGAPASIDLPAAWANLPMGFSWLATLLRHAPDAAAVVQGLTIDPELPKGADPSNKGSVAYQNIACWLDWAKRTSNMTTELGIGMALEVDSHTLAKLNTMPFPATGDLAALIHDSQPAIHAYLGADGLLTWRSAAEASEPILSMAYMEAYVGNTPPAGDHGGPPPSDRPVPGAYFRWMNDHGATAGETPTPRSPAEAAEDFQRSLLDWPYAAGAGTITVAVGSGNTSTVTGVGTNFDELQQYAALTSVSSDGARLPDAVPYWKVQDDKPAGATLTVTGPHVDVATAAGWEFTELTMDWQAPAIPAGLEERITFVFSVERGQDLPFFGYWELADFLEFMPLASGRLAGTDPTTSVFVDESGAGRGVPLANYGLYSLKQVCDQWQIATYPSASAVAPPATITRPPLLPATTIRLGGTVMGPMPVVISHAMVHRATASDPSLISFVVTAVSSGRVEKWNGRSWIDVLTPVASGSPAELIRHVLRRTIRPGDQIRWVPPTVSAQAARAFVLRGWDGVSVSDGDTAIWISP